MLQAELFSIERLEQHAATLAAEQRVTRRPGPRPGLSVRLHDNARVLLAAYRAIAVTVREGRPVTPAAEWLLDNYHVIEAQIRGINADLPPGFYRQLPKLASGPLAGYPRVFGIAWGFAAHTDCHLEPEALRRFVRAYQRVQPLTIGELWAVAITLRIVLIENLRRAAALIVGGRLARQEADALADRLLGMNGKAAEPDAMRFAYPATAVLADAFLVQLVQRLRDRDPDVTPALRDLETRLAAQGTTVETAVRDEHRRQGGANVTVRNIITSMRLISDTEWTDFFESVSLVDEVLTAGSRFREMDFGTRNLYRSAIEELARGSQASELDIARAAVEAAQRGASHSEREGDPGYHLIAAGRAGLEATLRYRAPLSSLPRRIVMRFGVGAYIAAISLVSLLAVGFAVSQLDSGTIAPWKLGVLALLGLVPGIDAAVALVNRAVTRGFGAKVLPGLALRAGVPAQWRTLIAVPTLLRSARGVAMQIERLEIHHLACTGGGGELHFALLTDWSDSTSEHVASDAELLGLAAAGIERLNARYPALAGGKRFSLFHRRRRWSAIEHCWMGWERKRGKLHELNRLLRGASDTSFVDIDGLPVRAPEGIRFVVTLDADTQVPHDTVRRLVGKLAHPLNRPRLDTVAGRVVEGYAILQPRVTAALPQASEGSLFQRVVSSAPGLDPYSAAVSDVYQDLFGEGSYAGKGIYDVDAFEGALAGRAAEGTLLSHDLFEGIFARAGLASDVEVVEEFPARYDVDAARRYRWARGDWQLLPWLFGRRHAGGGGRERSSLPLIGRWKILDNLRRTASAPACVAALVVGWTLPAHAALVWTALVLATIALPTLLPVLGEIVPQRAGISLRGYFRALGSDLWLALRHIGFQIVLLPAQAALMLDAIGRTLYRVFVSHRRLLQWVTAADAGRDRRPSFRVAYRQMSGGLVITVASGAVVGLANARNLWMAAPWLLLWLASPMIAVGISRAPTAPRRLTLDAAERQALRLIARRTWRFFETWVTAADQMLPPDNFQEDPLPVLAHRTSPTNIGLYLLSTVSAREFGWIGTQEAVERLEATFATLDRLERFRGHLFNWYDTRDLRPLEPRYVSTVDSGNLAAHLITLANALKSWAGEPGAAAAPPPAPDDPRTGLRDALALAAESLAALADTDWAQGDARASLEQRLAALEHAVGAGDTSEHLETLAAGCATSFATAAGPAPAPAWNELLYWVDAARKTIRSSARPATPERLRALAARADQLARAMQFGFLLDPERRLLSIGYRMPEGALDPSCYDLLASEARLASFFGIAKGDLRSRHWFRLGRPVTAVGHGAALLSWSGSMFEYLMPELVMRAPESSLLGRTDVLIVQRQMHYADGLGIPWGTSESAYNARDLEFTYQYSNFGVPGLGLKRGLSESLVIAPYATALAAMIDPSAAATNFARLRREGGLGSYGFYEALDYTASRVPAGSAFALVRAYMAHHQGMTIVALANVLHQGLMRRRFHAEPCVQASELLLQERTPRDVSVAHPRAEQIRTAPVLLSPWVPPGRRHESVHGATPEVCLLSNGRYSLMVTAAGSGYSRWQDLAITRWSGDGTRDDSGSYLYLRDTESRRVWSVGYQPCATEGEHYAATFTEDRAEFEREDGALTTTLELVVSPEDDAEARELRLTNAGYRPREIEVTSYAELVLDTAAADQGQPVFSKLFVETEYLPELGVLLATRRRRAVGEREIWVAHHVAVEGSTLLPVEYETDRAKFLGRGREPRAPAAALDGHALSNTVGAVLDPVFALRHRLRIAPGATVRLVYWTAVAGTRSGLLDLVDRHRDGNAFVRATTLAWTQAQVQLQHLGITGQQAGLFQRLAGHLLYADGCLRPSSAAIRRGAGGPELLWPQGISGDRPILLLRIDEVDDIEIARQLLLAHEYWHLKQLSVDLVILNERAPSYVQDLQVALESLVRMSAARRPAATGRAAGTVFVLRADLITAEARAALHSVARVVLANRLGSLEEQLDRARAPHAAPPRPAPVIAAAFEAAVAPRAVPELELYNGYGGFGSEGREYVIHLKPGRPTPLPWINVIANTGFGFQVAAEGSGYTWSGNSRENALTPRSNDPITDRSGEALYLRDDDTGEIWSATAAPVQDPHATHTARHGQGYSRFEHVSRGIGLELLMFVPQDDPLKISRLTVRNVSRRPRRLTLTAYVEWVLGALQCTSAPFVITELDPTTGAIFATNRRRIGTGTRVAFADLGTRVSAWTADRREFLGRHGSLVDPAALRRSQPLGKRAGAGLDPCAALQRTLELGPGASAECVFLLGEAEDANAARALIIRTRAADLDAVLRQVVDGWEELLGAVQVKTPDRGLDLLLNRWLLYQTLVCRLWARSAFYQASGAYGFRDQLQDSMALLHAKPALARAQLLRAAARQFVEGDVQHWWLPESGQGVRTRITDDRLWLAYVAAHYVRTTGDRAVLDAPLPFLEGPQLAAGEVDAFFLPVLSEESGTLFEHVARALDQSLQLGPHGLPLFGSGDWNDGMNRVGAAGRGESVWLGWFLYAALTDAGPLAVARGESLRAARWAAAAAALKPALESAGWDGDWYRRGFYDDASTLGSAADTECRIDSIAQSWSVLSGAAEPARAARAMAAVGARLIEREPPLALLFTPPFDHSTADPGYVKGYPPGVRENGGQYSHAATWSVFAYAALGQPDEALDLLSILNPLNRSRSLEEVARYQVEPYVMAADVYSVAPHAGRGGWTWYTGSAGWMYRAGIEAILGFRREGEQLLLAPCIPAHWPGFSIDYRFGTARYSIRAVNAHAGSSPPHGRLVLARAELDGRPLPGFPVRVTLADDGARHEVLLTLEPESTAAAARG
jgi:cyclic beta-1,2-glucan synthetase